MNNIPKTLKYRKHQIGKSNKVKDVSRDALTSGKRLSKTGRIYYEYRKNRSDLRGSRV